AMLRLTVVALVLVTALPAAADFAVGTSSRTFSDPDRGGRAIGADLFYPAVSAGANQPVADPGPEGFAVVAFGHGYLLSASLYQWVAADLAAKGCVVAVARTGGELFPDHEAFGEDLAFLTRAVKALGDDAGSDLFGRLNGRSAVAGHSMGGGASFLAAASDPAISGLFAFAPAETDPSAIGASAAIGRPLLIMAGSQDCVTPPADHQIPMYQAAMTGWRTLVTLTGASHCQFNANSLTCNLGEFCSATISRQVQQERALAVLAPWVRSVLFAEPGALEEFRSQIAAADYLTYEEAGLPSAVGGDRGRRLALTAEGPSPAGSRLAFRLEGAEPGPVTVEVFDLRGRLVRTWTDEAGSDGRMQGNWNGQAAGGGPAAAGVYFVRVRTGAGQADLKFSLVR
ncbi:alpha/beta hydrolase, partial [bacterium]|nr:alpha/beta hydrolase [bacterium]